jgi:predicted CXXCH cytochrome family protein
LLTGTLTLTARADNGPHGGFNGSTEACASCHRAHSAESSDGFLLIADDIYALCTSCHDGTGAYTNVVDGYYDTRVGDPGKGAFAGGWGDPGAGLFGGGFVHARMLTDYGNAANEGGLANDTANTGANRNLSTTSWARWNAYDTSSVAPVGRNVTSAHPVHGSFGTVWGSGNYSSLPKPTNGITPTIALECTSCHDPHGNAGRKGGSATGVPYPSYRLLRFAPEGSNGFEVTSQIGPGGYWDTDMTWAAASGLTGAVVPSAAGVLVPDPAVKWYSVNSDLSLDGMLAAYRGRVGSGEIFVANFAGLGDYMGRYYGYERPAGTVTAATTNTVLSCANGSGVPTVPGTACGATSGTAFNNVPSHDTLGFWCATCHDRYLAPGGASRTTDTGDALYHFQHRSQGLSDTAFGTGQYTCVDCHNAHGTAATASSPLAAGASYFGGSVLLKADNRAICARCHAGSVNFFNITTSPGAPMVTP